VWDKELSLDALLVDPMVRLVMRSDGIEEAGARTFLHGVRDRMKKRDTAWRRQAPRHEPNCLSC
jgi:hypothetical protein